MFQQSPELRKLVWGALLITLAVIIIVGIGGYILLRRNKCSNSDTESHPPSYYWPVQDARLLIPQLLQNLEWTLNDTVLAFSSSRNGNAGKATFMLILPEVDKVQGHLYSVNLQPSLAQNWTQWTVPHPRVTYDNVVSLFDNNSWSDQTFHKIFAVHLFHQFSDLSEILHHFKSLLQPQTGQLAFTTLTAQAFEVSMLAHLSQIAHWKPYLKNFTSKAYPVWSEFSSQAHAERGMRSMFRKTGFLIDHVHSDTMTLFYENFEIFFEERISMLQSVLAEVPEQLISQLKNDARGLFPNLTGIPADTINFNISYNYITGIATNS